MIAEEFVVEVQGHASKGARSPGQFRISLRMTQNTIFLQAALNGDRIHPAAPRTPAAIAEAARAAVDAGAQSVHVHAFDDAGRETLEGVACAKVLRAIRALCPARFQTGIGQQEDFIVDQRQEALDF